MMSTGMYPGPRPDRASAQRKREAALARLRRVRGVTVIGAGALTAAVAGVVSSASGRSLGAKHYVRSSTPVTKLAKAVPATSTHAKMPRLASAAQLGLGAPSSAPQAAPSSQSNSNAAAQAQASQAQPAPTQTQAQSQASAQAQAQAPAQTQAAPSAPAVSGGS